MALEAVVFQKQNPFGHGVAWARHPHHHLHLSNNNPEKGDDDDDNVALAEVLRSQQRRRHRHNSRIFTSDDLPPPSSSRPKRRRCRSRKNKEEMENQRMTHIAVERNRRKQMNDYLTILRSLMPHSYVQRGDQASTIGGAINFLKELEQRLHFLTTTTTSVDSSPFSEFFSFPQFSTAACGADSTPATADVEVTMVESHANIKIRSRRRPNQLHAMVSGLQMLRLAILHLNITTAGDLVLYCVSVKIEDDCRLTSVDEIAAAVHQLLCINVQENAMLTLTKKPNISIL